MFEYKLLTKVHTLISNLAAVTGHSQEACIGPQSSSSQLPPSGESSPQQRKRKKMLMKSFDRSSIHRRRTPVHRNWGLVAGSYCHLMNHSHPKKNKWNKMPTRCHNRRSSLVCSLVLCMTMKYVLSILGTLTHQLYISCSSAACA